MAQLPESAINMLAQRYAPTSWEQAARSADHDARLACMEQQWARGHRHWLFLGTGKSTALRLFAAHFLRRSVLQLDGISETRSPEELGKVLATQDAVLFDNLDCSSADVQRAFKWIRPNQVVMATAHSMQALVATRFTATAAQWILPDPDRATWCAHFRRIVQQESSLAHLRASEVPEDVRSEWLEYASLMQLSLEDARARWEEERRPYNEWTDVWCRWMRSPTGPAADAALFAVWRVAVRLHRVVGICVYDLLKWGQQCGRAMRPATQRVLSMERVLGEACAQFTVHISLTQLARWLYAVDHHASSKFS